jgi:ADP-heptose:LPS heptosyltransferase
MGVFVLEKILQKILVLNGNGVGDVILSTPILKSIKGCYPGSRLTFLVRPENEELVKGLQFIDDYVLYEKQAGVSGMLATVRKVWRYDIALCLDFKYRSAVIPFFAGIPIRAGLKHKRGALMTHGVDRDPLEEEKYEPCNFANIIMRSVGISLGDDLEQLYLPEPTKAQIDKVDRLFAKISPQPGEFILSCAPFTSTKDKDWQIENYHRLFSQLKSSYRCKIIILGKLADTGIETFHGIHTLLGQTSLLEMGEVIRRSNLFIGGCSAPLHAAAAVRTPIIAIYNSTSPAHWAPRNNATILYKRMNCSPCNGRGRSCTHHMCTSSITVDEVFAAVRTRLGDRAN